MINSISPVNNQSNYKQTFGSATKTLAGEAFRSLTELSLSEPIYVVQDLMSTIGRSVRDAARLKTVIDFNPETKMITLNGVNAKSNEYTAYNFIGRLHEAVKEASEIENPAPITREQIFNYTI